MKCILDDAKYINEADLNHLMSQKANLPTLVTYVPSKIPTPYKIQSLDVGAPGKAMRAGMGIGAAIVVAIILIILFIRWVLS